MSYAVHRNTDLAQELELLRFMLKPVAELAHNLAAKSTDPAASTAALSIVAPTIRESIKDISAVAAVEHRRQESGAWTAQRVQEVFRELISELMNQGMAAAAATVERVQNKYLTGDGHLVPGPSMQAISLMQAMDDATLGAYNGTPYTGMEAPKTLLEATGTLHD